MEDISIMKEELENIKRKRDEYYKLWNQENEKVSKLETKLYNSCRHDWEQVSYSWKECKKCGCTK